VASIVTPSHHTLRLCHCAAECKSQSQLEKGRMQCEAPTSLWSRTGKTIDPDDDKAPLCNARSRWPVSGVWATLHPAQWNTFFTFVSFYIEYRSPCRAKMCCSVLKYSNKWSKKWGEKLPVPTHGPARRMPAGVQPALRGLRATALQAWCFPSTLCKGHPGIPRSQKSLPARQQAVTELKAIRYSKLKLQTSCGAGITKNPERAQASMFEIF